MRYLNRAAILGFLMVAVSPAWGGGADVVNVQVSGAGPQYRFAVTVRHADTGWDHYADVWEVVGDDGTLYGRRVLAHPHVEEQPFTRSGTAMVPEGISEVTVRAGDSVHGFQGASMRVTLPGR